MPDKPDQILVEQSQAGYSEAFGLLAKKYQRKVYEIAYRFTQNVDEASDLSQEIFVKAYRALPNFESSSTFYTWLYRIAYNAGIDYTRRRKTRPEHLFSDEFPNDQQLLHPRVTDQTGHCKTFTPATAGICASILSGFAAARNRGYSGITNWNSKSTTFQQHSKIATATGRLCSSLNR